MSVATSYNCKAFKQFGGEGTQTETDTDRDRQTGRKGRKEGEKVHLDGQLKKWAVYAASQPAQGHSPQYT